LWGSRRDNDIDLEPDELGRDLGEALVAPFPPAILDCDIATVDQCVLWPKKPMVGSLPDCCARAASGHAAAAPPRSVTPPSQSIELHSVPASQGRTTGYRIGED
jgi:hypothetical protein